MPFLITAKNENFYDENQKFENYFVGSNKCITILNFNSYLKFKNIIQGSI